MPRKNNAKSNEALFEEAENALIGEAIAETEEEIAASAFDEEPDENTGDDSLEQMDDEGLDGEDQFDEEGDAESGEDEIEEPARDADDGGDAEYERDNRQQDRTQDRQQDRRGIPSAVLRDRNEARRAAEAERDAERARVRELEARLALVERGGQRQEPAKPPEKPDMFADPDGWARAQRAEIEQGIRARNVEASLADAAEEHGEAFQTAYQSLINAGRSGDRATVQQIWDSPNPGRALMRWHERQSLLSEIGSDPNAYRQKVRDELLSDPDFRKQLLTGMREDAMRGDGGRPRTQTRLPPSLNAASGGTSHRGGGGNMNGRDTARTTRSIEQDIFDSAFDD
jgi:hypothetical protein